MRQVVSSLLQAVGILWVGLFVRYRRGPSMLDPFFFVPFACLSAILVGPILGHLHPRGSGTIGAHLRAAISRACAWMSLILLVSLLSLNLAPWRGGWLLPEWSVVFSAAALSVASTTAMAAVMALLIEWFPAPAAKWIFRVVVLSGIVVYWKAPGRWGDYGMEAVLTYGLSTVALTLAAGLALIAAGLLLLLRALPGRNKRQGEADLR